MKKTVTVATALSLLAAGTFGADMSAKASYDTAKKQAATRYADDRKLCADETTSSVRMQCLRGAKTEYSATLKAASETYKKASAVPAAAPVASTAVCTECGKVTSLKVVEKEGESSPLGLIAGGVAGAVLGHQVGGGTGKDLATIAGGVGGAYAGHKIEQKVRSTKEWVVGVHLDNGEDRTFNFPTDPGYAVGDMVKLSGNGIVRR